MAEIIIPGGGGESDEQPQEGASKIHVDSDWKAQAQAEKDRLVAESEQQAASGGGAGPGGLPEPSFQALWTELASQAYMFLGAIPDPKTGQAIVAPEYARHYIDLLGVLREKTAGNLTEEESGDFEKVIAELRQVYVRVSGYVSEELAKQEAQGGQGQPNEQGGGQQGGGEPNG